MAGDVGQDGNQIIRADVFLKGFVQSGIGLKIEVSHVVIVGAAKFQKGVGLSHLTGPLKNQRLAVRTVFPGF